MLNEKAMKVRVKEKMKRYKGKSREARGTTARLRAKRMRCASSGNRTRSRTESAKRRSSNNKSNMSKDIENECLQVVECEDGACKDFLRCMIEKNLPDENLPDALMERRRPIN